MVLHGPLIFSFSLWSLIKTSAREAWMYCFEMYLLLVKRGNLLSGEIPFENRDVWLKGWEYSSTGDYSWYLDGWPLNSLAPSLEAFPVCAHCSTIRSVCLSELKPRLRVYNGTVVISEPTGRYLMLVHFLHWFFAVVINHISCSPWHLLFSLLQCTFHG